jgi:hypothetical protein
MRERRTLRELKLYRSWVLATLRMVERLAVIRAALSEDARLALVRGDRKGMGARCGR